jgi:hypothetical protein
MPGWAECADPKEWRKAVGVRWLICVAQRDAGRVRGQGGAINCGAGTYA